MPWAPRQLTYLWGFRGMEFCGVWKIPVTTATTAALLSFALFLEIRGTVPAARQNVNRRAIGLGFQPVPLVQERSVAPVTAIGLIRPFFVTEAEEAELISHSSEKSTRYAHADDGSQLPRVPGHPGPISGANPIVLLAEPTAMTQLQLVANLATLTADAAALLGNGDKTKVSPANTRQPSAVFCVEWMPYSHDGNICKYHRSVLQYSWFPRNGTAFRCDSEKVRDPRLVTPWQPQWDNCEPIIASTTGNDLAKPTAIVAGKTLLFVRTPHLPHFLEEIGGLWSHPDQTGLHNVVFVGENKFTDPCVNYDGYLNGGVGFMPNSKFLNKTVEYLLLRSLQATIFSSWGVGQDKRMCWADASWSETVGWGREPTSWFEHRNPALCQAFRAGVETALGLEQQGKGGVKHSTRRLLIGHRGHRGIANLEELETQPEMAEFSITAATLGVSAGAVTALEQIGLFHEADVYVSAHGAAMALTSMMKPGSLVIEVFPFNTRMTCRYFSSLSEACEHQHVTIVASDVRNQSVHPSCSAQHRNETNVLTDISELVQIITAWMDGRLLNLPFKREPAHPSVLHVYAP